MTPTLPDVFAGKHVHLLGIGGAGMSALVPLLLARGAQVSGCDPAISGVIDGLRTQGVAIATTHDPAHAAEADLLVHTAAIPQDHPELAAGRARGIPVLGRGECLARLMQGRTTLAVSGSHGKTSTTWMLGHLLQHGDVDPLVMVGGTVASLGGGARIGQGPCVVEADESDGSFARIDADVAVVTNLDHEHLRHYGTFRALEDAFNAWLRRVPADGLVIVPAATLADRVLTGVRAQVVTCGLDLGDVHVQDLKAEAEGSRFRIIAHGEDLGEVVLGIPGVHMVHNALMAVAAARHLRPNLKPQALATCERVRRRFTVHATTRGIRVVEDYGHHPAEVRATIAAARLAGGKVHVLFQPHRWTRTADCFAAFTEAFDQAHRLALLPVYAAGETPIAGASSADLAKALVGRRAIAGDEPASVLATANRTQAIRHLLAAANPGDTVLILGAGDVGSLAGAVQRQIAGTATTLILGDPHGHS